MDATLLGQSCVSLVRAFLSRSANLLMDVLNTLPDRPAVVERSCAMTRLPSCCTFVRMTDRKEGPYYQFRDSSGRYSGRDHHSCDSAGPSRGEAAALVGLGALIAMAGTALYRWWTGTNSEADLDERSQPRLPVRIPDETLTDLSESVARRGQALESGGATPSELAALFDDMAADLLELAQHVDRQSLSGGRVHIDPEVWGSIMQLRKDLRSACIEAKRELRRSGVREVPPFRAPLDLQFHPTAKLLGASAHQLRHAAEVARVQAGAAAVEG